MYKTFKPNFLIEDTDRKITSNPGFAFFIEAAQKLGTRKVLQENLHPTGKSQDYHPEVHVLTIAGLLACGGQALTDVEGIRKDEGICALLGMDKLPAHNTLSDWLGSYPEDAYPILQEEITRLTQEQVKRQGVSEIILDPDVTLIERYKKGLGKTYKGFYGYSPMVVTEAVTGMVWWTEFRAGNVSPSSGAIEVLKTILQKVPQEILVSLRVDSAWYQLEVMDYCNEYKKNKVQFTITADMDSSVKGVIQKIPEKDWKPLADEPGSEIAETIHTLNKSKYAYRLVVVRKKRWQFHLFEGKYFYHAIITNREDTPEQILKFHRGRGSDEHINSILKDGYSGESVPCNSQNANGVYWMIACMAHNIMEASKEGLPEGWRPFRIKKLRFRWLKVAAMVVCTAGYTILRIHRTWPWKKEAVNFLYWCRSG